MSEMDTYLEVIATGHFGRDVRAALHDAIELNANNISELEERPAAVPAVLVSSSPLKPSISAAIVSLTAKGSSKQNGDPTPATPIPIEDASGVVTAIGKNLLDVSQTPSLVARCTVSVSDNTVTLTCNASGNTYAQWGIETEIGKTYTASIGEVSGLGFVILDTNGSAILTKNGSNASGTFTATETKTIIRVYASGTVGASYTFKNVMLEEGTTATAYTPYTSNSITLPYTLRSVSNVKDELIVNEDGSGELVQRVGAVRFSDLTNPTFESANSRFAFTVNNCKAQAARTLEMLCDVYTAITDGRALASVPNNSVYASGDGTKIYVHDNSTTDASLLLDNIGDKYIYYPFATPIVTPLTASEVADILKLQTYKGTTIIDAEVDAELGFALDIKDYVDERLIYSEEETICGYEADGQPRYRRVIHSTTPSSPNTDKFIDFDLSNKSIKRLDGTIDTSAYVFPINFFFSTTYNATAYIAYSRGIALRVGSSDYANKPCEIAVEYTKKNTSREMPTPMMINESPSETNSGAFIIEGGSAPIIRDYAVDEEAGE